MESHRRLLGNEILGRAACGLRGSTLAPIVPSGERGRVQRCNGVTTRMRMLGACAFVDSNGMSSDCVNTSCGSFQNNHNNIDKCAHTKRRHAVGVCSSCIEVTKNDCSVNILWQNKLFRISSIKARAIGLIKNAMFSGANKMLYLVLNKKSGIFFFFIILGLLKTNIYTNNYPQG